MIKKFLFITSIILVTIISSISLSSSTQAINSIDGTAPALAVEATGAGGGAATGSGGDAKKADDDSGGGTTGGGAATFSGGCREIAGFTSWDCGVNISNQETLKSGIWTIAANVLTDVTVLAAYLVIGYVIYGGYLYVFSSGEPSKIMAAKKTLSQAFLGLAIVMSSSLIMSTVRFALMGNKSMGDCVTQECVDPGALFTNSVQWAIGIAGFVAVIFVIYGAITYITSSGDPSKLQKAKQIIIYALIGLAIVALAEIITTFVSSTIRSANQKAMLNQTIISKEVHEIKTT